MSAWSVLESGAPALNRADGDPHAKRQQKPDCREDQGVRNSFRNGNRNCTVLGEGIAQVALGDATEVAEILFLERSVQAEICEELSPHLRWNGLGFTPRYEWIPGRDVDKEERDRRDQEDDCDRLNESKRNEPRH